MSAPTHSLTLLSPDPAFDTDRVRALLSAKQVAILEQRVLPAPRALSSRRRCQLFTLADVRDPEALRAALTQLSDETAADLVLQDMAIRLADYRLALFDMDSTLIECEVIDELARRHGVGPEVATITERAMRGELDFDQSFTQRLGMLRGLSAEVIADIAANLPVTEGVRELLPTLRALGIRTGILSGGFLPFAQALQQAYGFDEVHANTLAVQDGQLTGEVVPPIVNGSRKAQLLESLALQHGLKTSQVIAVGDGANDLPMLGRAGLGVAFRAKPVVSAQADHSIRHVGLDGLIYLLGAASELVPASA